MLPTAQEFCYKCDDVYRENSISDLFRIALHRTMTLAHALAQKHRIQ